PASAPPALKTAEPRQQPHKPMKGGREHARLLRELRRTPRPARELIGQAELRGGVERPRHPVAHSHLDDLGVRRRHIRGFRAVVSHGSLRCEREKSRSVSRTDATESRPYIYDRSSLCIVYRMIDACRPPFSRSRA